MFFFLTLCVCTEAVFQLFSGKTITTTISTFPSRYTQQEIHGQSNEKPVNVEKASVSDKKHSDKAVDFLLTKQPST